MRMTLNCCRGFCSAFQLQTLSTVYSRCYAALFVGNSLLKLIEVRQELFFAREGENLGPEWQAARGRTLNLPPEICHFIVREHRVAIRQKTRHHINVVVEALSGW